MRIKSDFELMEIAGEYLIIPVGKEASSFEGVVVINEEVYFLMKHLQENKTIIDLIELLEKEYEVEACKAKEDVEQFVKEMFEMGLLEE